MSVMDSGAAVAPPAHQRPRAFSSRSDKSGVSGSSGRTPKVRPEDLKETHAEKRRLTATTKANPNQAMNEAQPVATALEKATIGSLRSVQHVDSLGNPITDPDLSNPTRSRWERPLDTIKSFEAAIEGEYKRRSMIRSETAPSVIGGFASRRSSYFGGYNDGPPGSRYSQVGGYYGGRGARESYIENDYGAPMAGPPSRNRFSQRLQSQPMPQHQNGGHQNGGYQNGGYQNGGYQNGQHQNGQDLYPQHGHQRSRDTVNTGSSSEPWTNNTDPSSENSSIDRIAAMGDPYAQKGYGGPGGPGQFHNPALDSYYNRNGIEPPSPSRGGPVQEPYSPTSPMGPPPVPAHDPAYSNPGPRRVIKLGGAGGAPAQSQPLSASSGNRAPARPIQSTPSQKKKSWLKRTFSRNG